MTAPGRSSQPQPSSRVTRNEPTSAVGVRREASDKTRLSDISFLLPDAALPFTFLRWTALRPRRTVRFSPARSLPANDGLLVLQPYHLSEILAAWTVDVIGGTRL